MQVLSLKGIRSALDIDDFAAIAALRQLEELVLDCDQPPELGGIDEIKWGLPEFPEGVLHLVNITHLTLSCHYGITELPAGITSLNKLEVRPQAPGSCTATRTLDKSPEQEGHEVSSNLCIRAYSISDKSGLLPGVGQLQSSILAVM